MQVEGSPLRRELTLALTGFIVRNAPHPSRSACRGVIPEPSVRSSKVMDTTGGTGRFRAADGVSGHLFMKIATAATRSKNRHFVQMHQGLCGN